MNLDTTSNLQKGVSLCIATYNWHIALKLCLESVLQQTVLPNEILIGDDGSTNETAKIIKEYQQKFCIPVKHIWHEDKGFRLAEIRNKCFEKASHQYIIQIDGDLILHKNFIKDHLSFAKKNTFVCGTRAMINATATQQLLANQKIDWQVILTNLSKKKNGISNKLIANIIYFFKRGYTQYKYVLGANMAFWKKDLLAVNGYNTVFTGWGKEDNDIAIRLLNAKVGIRFIKNAAIVYHLHHNEASRNNMQENEIKLLESVKNKITFIEHGIVKKI